MTSNSDIENYIQKKLEALGICYFSVISTNAFGDSLVAITLYTYLELDELLDKIDYKYLCDKSGFLIIRETNTVIFTKSGLVQLVDKL